MADKYYRDGNLVSLQFELANPPENATTDMTFANSGAGFKVPTGYDFYPQILHVESNADLTAGTMTAKVIDDGTEVSNGPEPALSDTVQVAVAEVDPLAVKIAAGSIVGVSLTADASYAPNTADYDAVLVGRLLPTS